MLYLVKDLDADDYIILSTTKGIVNYVFKNDKDDIWHSPSQLLTALPHIPHNSVKHLPYHEWIIASFLNLRVVFTANSLEELAEQITNSSEVLNENS